MTIKVCMLWNLSTFNICSHLIWFLYKKRCILSLSSGTAFLDQSSLRPFVVISMMEMISTLHLLAVLDFLPSVVFVLRY